jgi:TonB family protein
MSLTTLFALLLTGQAATAPAGKLDPLSAPPPMTYRAPPAPPPYDPSRDPPERTRANLASYFSDDDYPAVALRAEEEGTVSFRLTIDADGRVADCQVTASSGSAALDSATCRILRSRARYSPARDARGRPTIGSDAARVTWRLPPAPVHHAVARVSAQGLIRAGDYPQSARAAGEEGVVGYEFDVDVDGRISSCQIVAPSGSDALDEATCALLQARALYRPATDASGQPVEDQGIAGVMLWRLPPRRGVTSAGPPAVVFDEEDPWLARNRRASAMSRAPLALFFGPADYPAPALARRASGRVGIAFTVTAGGRLSGCTVSQSSGAAALDAASCRILELRARYFPAQDRSLRAVPDNDIAEIQWVLG